MKVHLRESGLTINRYGISGIKVRNEIIKKIGRLCGMESNSNNLFKEINEHAISEINYHMGVLNSGLVVSLDYMTISGSPHVVSVCKNKRLYLPKSQMGYD